MTIKLHDNITQGTQEWFDARLGLLTASEMKLIITPTMKYASNDKERTHLYELAAQRANKHVEPTYVSFDMERGKEDEIDALHIYHADIGPVEMCGFITNDDFLSEEGNKFIIGYSPDGLVGDHGQIEVKSRKQKYQMETILSMQMPVDYLIQVQTGLLVSKRQWCDFVSYCGGMPMMTLRVYPDLEVHEAITNAAGAFEDKLVNRIKEYRNIIRQTEGIKFIPTKRKPPMEITA